MINTISKSEIFNIGSNNEKVENFRVIGLTGKFFIRRFTLAADGVFPTFGRKAQFSDY